MGTYCDFNPRLFKEFVSMKTKIKPELSDDWEIIPDAYNTQSGMILYSKSLNQKVADIDLRRFLRFSKEQNLVITGLKLSGEYIIGNDRAIYTKEMLQIWKNKYESRTETIIQKKDWIPGHKYLSPCGADFIYIGSKYIARLNKNDMYDGKFNRISKVQKDYIGIDSSFLENKWWSSESPEKVKYKFTKDLGKVLDDSKINELMLEYYHKNTEIVCYEDEKPKKEEYELFEIDSIISDSKYPVISNILFCGINNVIYTSYPSYNKDRKYFYVCHNKNYNILNESKMISENHSSRNWYDGGSETKVNKFYRLGLKK